MIDFLGNQGIQRPGLEDGRPSRGGLWPFMFNCERERDEGEVAMCWSLGMDGN